MKIDEVSSMTPEDGKILLKIARESVEEHILGIRKPEVRSIDTSVRQNAGVFVTLKIHGNLRGCIGFVEAIYPLYIGVQKAAVYAATDDPRFPPVSKDEVGILEYEVTVLSDTEEIRTGKDVDLNALIVRGVHGLEISRGIRRGLLLPQVMEELNLSPLQFLDETCFKAGMTGRCWEEPGTRVYRFMGKVFS
ncbi:MAG: AmmeMemoRadiSam system protein A [Thermoplasmataceae archaeon]